MTTILKNVNSTISPTYGAIPPFPVGSTTAINNGQFLTSTGSNGTGYTNTWTTGTNTINANPAITVKGTDPAELEIKGRMVINGRDLEERLDTIEKVLQIPERDVILEKKHPKLKKLYDDYINALGKYRTFEAIKGDNNGTT